MGSSKPSTSARRKQPLVDVRDVCFERDFTPILTDIAWTVRPRENWIVFGPNGAGKTTLLSIIQGYLWPTSGAVSVLGERLGDGVDIRDLRKALPVVSEAVRTMINTSLTGLQVLITGARAHLNLFEAPTPGETKHAIGIAQRLLLEPLLEKPFGVMSTGERQQILIGRALMASPRIVLLDEPCAGLDLAGRERLLQSIDAIARFPAAPTVLFTTHHLEEIGDVFTHALLLKEGRAFACGKIDEMLTSRMLSGLFGMELKVRRVGRRWTASAG